MTGKGLGKGLEALISGISEEKEETTQELKISELRPNPYQPRKNFEESSLQELTNSMKEHGLIQPLIVRKSIHGYEIVAGERRFRAAKLAGLSTVPVIIRNCDDNQMMEIALIENIQREDLNPIEIATAYQKLMEHFPFTQDNLAERVGKSRPHVTNFLRLLQLPHAIQQDVSRGTISMGHARTLLGVKDQGIQKKLTEKVKKEKASVRELEDWVQKLNEDHPKKKKEIERKASPIVRRYEGLLQELFHTPVKIKQGKKKGKIEIEYYSEQELERLIEFMNQKRIIE